MECDELEPASTVCHESHLGALKSTRLEFQQELHDCVTNLNLSRWKRITKEAHANC